MSLFTDTLVNGWTLNGPYLNQLVADLDQADMLTQPAHAPDINHPAWIVSHLQTYHPVIESLLKGEVPDDPMDARYGMKSRPLSDPAEYLPRDELIRSYNDSHARVLAAAEAADEAVLSQPMPVQRWADRGFPMMGSILGYLMVRHESLHLGQLSTWRRTVGKGRV